MIDYDSKLIDWIQIAYDNSEGFLMIKSKIEKDEIEVTIWNYFADHKPKKNLYKISMLGFNK